jgi:hypothetical protein
MLVIGHPGQGETWIHQKMEEHREMESALHRLAKELSLPDHGPDENVTEAVSQVRAAINEMETKNSASAAALQELWLKFRLAGEWEYPGQAMRHIWEEHQSKLQRAWTHGILEGIRLFAWWKDGVQYVGSCGTTLEHALKEVPADYQKIPPRLME